MKQKTFALSRSITPSLFVALFACIGVQGARGSTATVSVTGNGYLATIPAAAYGMNTAVFDGDMIDAGVESLMAADGITALRFPGGSYSDNYHWSNNSSTPLNSSIGDG